MRGFVLSPAVLIMLSACGSDVSTRVTVENTAAAPVSVEVRSSDDAVVSFDNVPAGTTPAFEEVAFESLAEVQIEVLSGDALPGAVTLAAGADNTIVLSENAAPRRETTPPPSSDSGGGFW